MEEQKEQEFNLEDIMREFGDEPETPAPMQDEAPAEQASEVPPANETEELMPAEPEEIPDSIPLLIPEDHEPEPDLAASIAETMRLDPIPAAKEEKVTSDTVRLDAIDDATVRMDAIPAFEGEIRNAQPIDDEDEPFIPPQPEQTTEPYSEEWEPEYEQPISEYIPPKPIQFPPRSRLQELKKKLVAGPEKLYYRLSEQGSGKLQLAIFVNVLVLLLAAAGTILYHYNVIGENRLRLVVFGQFFCMLFAALVGSGQLVEGFVDLLRKRFSLNTLLIFSFLLCCADGVFGLREQRIPCCAAFSLQMTMSLWNTYHIRNIKLGQLDTMRKATRLDCLRAVPDYRDGKKGILRGEGQVEDFMDTYEKPSTQEKIVSIYAICALVLSIGAGVAAAVLHNISLGVQVAAITTLAAAPASMHVFLSRPMAILERRLHSVGTVLCGWQGAKGLSGKLSFPIDHRDLFPNGTAKMNGVKFFGQRQPDQVIAYATALVQSDGGVLTPLFTELLDSRNARHYEAEELTYYDGGGIGGRVNGEVVLAGSISFLRSMNVEIPEGLRIRNAICVAVEGELGGLFALSYDRNRLAAAGMMSICGYRMVKPVLMGGHFVLTRKFLSDHFGINPKRVHYATGEEQTELLQKQPAEDAPSLALMTRTSLAAYVYAITGARNLRGAAITGLVVHMFGGILGIAIMALLAVLGAKTLLTPMNLFLFELVWLVPGLLITEWTRTI